VPHLPEAVAAKVLPRGTSGPRNDETPPERGFREVRRRGLEPPPGYPGPGPQPGNSTVISVPIVPNGPYRPAARTIRTHRTIWMLPRMLPRAGTPTLMSQVGVQGCCCSNAPTRCSTSSRRGWSTCTSSGDPRAPGSPPRRPGAAPRTACSRPRERRRRRSPTGLSSRRRRARPRVGSCRRAGRADGCPRRRVAGGPCRTSAATETVGDALIGESHEHRPARWWEAAPRPRDAPPIGRTSATRRVERSHVPCRHACSPRKRKHSQWRRVRLTFVQRACHRRRSPGRLLPCGERYSGPSLPPRADYARLPSLAPEPPFVWLRPVGGEFPQRSLQSFVLARPSGSP
jgi:hypothetical protein